MYAMDEGKRMEHDLIALPQEFAYHFGFLQLVELYILCTT